MANTFFSIPDVYFGDNAIRSLARLNNKKVAIVTDAFMESSGKAQELIQAMPGADVQVFGKVKPDPSVDILKAGAAQFKAFKPDAIIALGGGSSQDAAKGIKVTLEDFYQHHAIELIAIPTTSGSGSEVTSYAIISDPENGRKHPLISQDLVPDAAILDPRLVVSVPKSVSMDTGMDVLTHAIEAMVSPGANDFSDALAQKATALTAQYLPQVFRNEQDIVAREHMHNASCMAGMAFNSAGLGLTHGMAHAIGGMLHIAHGKMNAMLLPLIIEFNHRVDDAVTEARYHTCARMMGIHTTEAPQAIREMVAMIRTMNAQFGIPDTLVQLGKDRNELRKLQADIVEAALADRCTATNPRQPSQQDVARLYTQIIG